MVFKAEGAHAIRKQMRETHAMDLWVALGIFLLGGGVGALTTVALYGKQIRQLKVLLEAEHNNSRTEKQKSETGRRNSA